MLTPLLFSIAVLLLFLVSISVPIAKHIFLFRLIAQSSGILASSASGSVAFGVWGYCISSIDISVAGFHHDTASSCSNPHLGYHFDSTVADALHVNGFEDLISGSLTFVLVLHPIACIITLAALLIHLYTQWRGTGGIPRLPQTLALFVSFFAAILTTVIFLIDVVFVGIVRHKLRNGTGGHLALIWGNAVWMTFGAALALWAATAVLFRTLTINRKKHNRNVATY